MSVLKSLTLTSFLAASLLAVSTALIPAAAFAQTPPVEDEVVTTGTIRGGDPAMGAFFRGDFETAEIEFQKNFRRLKRADMNLRDNIASVGNTAITGEVQNGLGATSSGGGGAAASTGADTSINYGSLTMRAQRDGEGVTSGTDMGFQLYMTAMSQLKLRKYEEARENFKTAIAMNKSLYDARLRLGLLDLRAGDIDGARQQLRRLDGQLRKCNDACDEVVEMRAAREVLSSAITKAGA